MTQPLAALKTGERGRIVGFAEDSTVTQRLMQLGILEGETIDVVRRAPAGDPIEIKILGYSLSLRTAEAAIVLVEPTVQA